MNKLIFGMLLLVGCSSQTKIVSGDKREKAIERLCLEHRMMERYIVGMDAQIDGVSIAEARKAFKSANNQLWKEYQSYYSGGSNYTAEYVIYFLQAHLAYLVIEEVFKN